MEIKTNRQRQALETKQKIFSCAVSLFAQKSFENVTVQDICTKAEVSVGAFYHHFKSKENILDEGYRLFDDESETAWYSGHPDSPLDSVRFLVSAQAHSMEKLGAPAALQYFKNQLSSKEKYILDTQRFFYQTIKSCVEQMLSDSILNGDPSVITEDILSGTRGIIYDWCLHSGSYDLTEKILRITDMVLHYYSY